MPYRPCTRVRIILMALSCFPIESQESITNRQSLSHVRRLVLIFGRFIPHASSQPSRHFPAFSGDKLSERAWSWSHANNNLPIPCRRVRYTNRAWLKPDRGQTEKCWRHKAPNVPSLPLAIVTLPLLPLSFPLSFVIAARLA
jgi:hypothetical protein